MFVEVVQFARSYFPPHHVYLSYSKMPLELVERGTYFWDIPGRPFSYWTPSLTEVWQNLFPQKLEKRKINT
jgi:hypothetical protein